MADLAPERLVSSQWHDEDGGALAYGRRRCHVFLPTRPSAPDRIPASRHQSPGADHDRWGFSRGPAIDLDARRGREPLGTLEFTDGAPSAATADLLHDHLDFIQGVQAFINSFPGASLEAMHEGFLSIGVEDNEILIFSELMDSASLFLTANCDTLYFITFLDLSKGPMVLDIPAFGPPSGILGTVDDMWFRWVTDFGVSGPDRAQGGRYLIVGPDYDGPLPEGGFHVSHARTSRVLAFGRAFMIDNDPAPAAQAVRDGVRIYPSYPVGRGRRSRRSSQGGAISRRPGSRSQRPGSSRAPARRSTRSRPTTTRIGR